jgi:hypothetical protein
MPNLFSVPPAGLAEKLPLLHAFLHQLWQKTCTFDELLAAGRQPLALAGGYFYKNRPGRQLLAVAGGDFCKKSQPGAAAATAKRRVFFRKNLPQRPLPPPLPKHSSSKRLCIRSFS